MAENIHRFIKKLESELEDIKPGTLKPETNFREIENWSSMHALIIIALLDTEYNITVRGEQLKKCSTVSDLFYLIESKK